MSDTLAICRLKDLATRWCWCLPLITMALGVGAAQDATTGFNEANRLYDQGRFRDAATAYEQVLKAGYVGPTLYFNMGNAWFKSGEIGRAIAAYRKAERLSPRDPDVRANLQFARNQVQAPTLARGRGEQWLAKLTVNEWTILAACGFWGWLLLGATLQWRPQWKRSLRNVLVGAGFVAVVLLVCLALAYNQARGNRVAVVIVPQASVKQGPLDEAQTAFVAHDGAEVRVLDEKDDWLQVSTDPRRIGWLRRTDLLE